MKPKAPGALCSKCTLKDEPFVPTDSPAKTELGAIGFAPGRGEVQHEPRIPLIGPSGRIFNTMLEEVGVKREDVYVSNIVLCKCPHNREPTPQEIRCCMPRLARELKETGVKRMLALGRVPRDVFMPEFEGQSIRSTRGRWHRLKGINIIVTNHPAFILRGQPDAYVDLVKDGNKWVNYPPEDWLYAEPQYFVLENHDQLKQAVKAALDADMPLCVDAETSNLDRKRGTPALFWENFILCLGFHWLPGKAIIVPEELFNDRKSLEILRPLFECKHGIYGHNVKYDMTYLRMYYDKIGMPLKKAFIKDDTYLMYALLKEVLGERGLKDVSEYYFDSEHYEKEIHKYLKNPKKDSYALVPPDKLHRYLALDIHYGVLVKELLERLTKEDGVYETPYRLFLVQALNVLQRAEYHGMPVNLERLDKVAQTMSGEVDELREELRKIAGKPDLNLNSPKQVAEVIFDDLKLTPPKKSGQKSSAFKHSSKQRSTAKEILEKMKGQHAFIRVLQKYRRWAKLYSTYAKKIPERVDPNGFSHYGFNIAGTETGRISGELLLTIPRKYTPEGKMIRDAFQAPDGFVLIGADFSQAELRWASWYSQDVRLMRIYKEGRDLHTEVAIQIYGKNFTREQRMYSKMLNFSFVYGGTEYSFAEDTEMPIEAAREVVRQYKATMPQLTAWRAENWRIIRERGYLVTPVGRKRRFPIITPKNWPQVQTESVNFRVQSISSDCTLWGWSVTADYFREQGWPIHPVLFLHDGCYFMVPDDDSIIKVVGRRMRQDLLWAVDTVMENAGTWVPEYAGLEPVPFKVDLEVGPSWGELHDLEV